GGEQRVDRHRHDPGLDGAEEGGREIDRVEEAKHDALLEHDAELRKDIGEAVDALGKLAVAVGAALVAHRDLAGATCRKIAPDEVDGGVVVARKLALHPGGRFRFGHAHSRHAPCPLVLLTLSTRERKPSPKAATQAASSRSPPSAAIHPSAHST